MRIKRDRARMIVNNKTAWLGIRIPKTVMREVKEELAQAPLPTGLWSTLKRAWICAKLAWRVS
jgi:hypothetical protein